MEEKHNDHAKPELKKPAFLEEEKPAPFKKTTLSFIQTAKPEEPEEAQPVSQVSWNTDELPVIEDVLGLEDPETEEAAGKPAAEEADSGEAETEKAVSGEPETEEIASEVLEAEKTASGELEAEENAAGELEAEGIVSGEPEAAEPADTETVSEEPVPEETAAKVSWNTDELPTIEDILGLEEASDFAKDETPAAEGDAPAVKEEIQETGESAPAATEAVSEEAAPAEKESAPADALEKEEDKTESSGSFHIPFFGGKKDKEDDEEKADSPGKDEQEAQTGEDEQEQEADSKFSLKMPSGSVKRILIAGVVILAIILVYSLIQSRKVYHSYEVMSEVSNTDDASESYQIIKYGMIRYSNNGIALTDKSGNVIWNQTYEMNNPIIASSGNYIAAGDRGASTLYIFNQFGQCGKLTTDLPLQGLQMAENGVVAAILSDSESNFINLYDKQGNRLVGIRATLENTGYPLAIGVSPDASKLVVSYLTVSDSARTQTKLVFYDFSSVNGEHEKLTGSINSLCPRIQFLGKQRVAVFREKGFDIYSVDGEVKMVFSTEFEDEIRSIFTGDQKLGFVFRNRDENGKFRIELYDVSGQKSMTLYSNLDYTDLNSDSDEVVLYNNSKAEIYKYNGKQVFSGSFENRISSLMPSWDSGMYWMVEESRVSEIRIK